MATTTVLSNSTLEVNVAEDLNDRGTAICNAPNNSGSSATAGSELLIRRVLPLEVRDLVAASEIVSLDMALAATSTSELSIWRTVLVVLVITTLAGLAFANSMSIGLITIGLPVIAADLDLAESLLLWLVAISLTPKHLTLHIWMYH
jgi:hypothetical protein